MDTKPGLGGGGVFSSRQSQGGHLSRFLRFRKCLILFIGFCPLFGSAAWADDAVQPAALTIIHTPLTQYVIGAPAEIRAVVSGEPDGLNFYFRQPGLETFQVKPMSPAEGGVFILDFDTSVLMVSSFEYYLEAWAGENRSLSPPDAPAQCHAVTGQGEAPPPIPQDIPTPQAQEAAFRLPIHLTATGLGMLSRNMKRPAAAESSGSGNLQGSFDFQPARRWGARIDATTAYTSARLPGANAVIPALTASGLPTDRFFFEGFLPVKSARRRRRLMELKSFPHTMIFYESVHRIAGSLADMADVFGPRRLCVGREISKIYEEYVRGPAPEVARHFAGVTPKGEFVIVVEGCREAEG